MIPEIDGDTDRVMKINETTRTIGETEAEYRLYRLSCGGRNTFAVTVEMDDEWEIGLFDGDALRAAETFRSIADGAVTPCTLRDVLSDTSFEAQEIMI